MIQTFLTQIGSFVSAIPENSVVFSVVTVMIAGAIGRFAFKTIKRFIH